MSDTPRTDEPCNVIMHQIPGCTKEIEVVSADFARQLERELNEASESLKRWKMAAWNCGLYRADVPHNSPHEWQTAQVDAQIKLLNERDQLRTQLLATEAAMVKMREALRLAMVTTDCECHAPLDEQDHDACCPRRRIREALTTTPTTALAPIREALESSQTMIISWQCVRDQILTDTASSRYFDKAKAQIKHGLSLCAVKE